MVDLTKEFGPGGYKVVPPVPPTYLEADDPRTAFMKEVRSHGFDMPMVPELGRIMRFDAPGEKRGKKSGWAWYDEASDNFLPGGLIGFGSFGSFKGNPDKVTWSSKCREAMSPNELAHYDEQRRVAKTALNAAIKEEHDVAAIRAQDIWNEATAAPEAYPYLTRKKISPHAVRVSRGRLIVPVIDAAGIITSLQFIDAEGGKKFLKGGKKKGGSFSIGGQTETIYVAEGFSTGATIHAATGDMVFCCFDAGNIMEVTRNVKDKHHDAQIIIAGDDDVWLPPKIGNTGRNKATLAAEALGVKTVFPTFDNVESKPTDFNDLAALEGLDAVREQLAGTTVEVAQAAYVISSKVPEFPVHCLNVDGVFGEICDWINRTAPIAQPILTLAAVLAMFGAVFGRRYQVPPYSTRTNLLTVGLLRTGGGKDHQRTTLKSLLELAGLKDLIMGGKFTSGTAVLSALKRYPVGIGFVDEFGLYLRELTGKNAAAHQQNVLSTIMELYSTAGSTFHGTEYANLTKSKDAERVDIFDPSLNIYGTSTLEKFYEALNSGDVASGALNRWLIFEGDDNARFGKLDFDTADTEPPPENVVNWLTEAHAFKPEESGNTYGIELPNVATSSPISVGVSPDARPALQAVRDRQETHGTDKSDPLRDLWARFFENTIKVAGIRAIADSPREPTIELHHVEWARDLVAWCVENTAHMMRSRVGDNERERLVKAIWRFIYEGGTSGRDLQHVTKKFQRLPKRERQEILAELEDIGAVNLVTQKREGAARTANVYISSGPPS